jgi:Restriction endonuclease
MLKAHRSGSGIGVYRVSLLSFPVFFQCKRYVGSVGSGAVRDFRGAMSGRGDKGLLITTGTFTSEAKRESTRDGAPPVDLIDGDQLCDLLSNTSSACTAACGRSRMLRLILSSSPSCRFVQPTSETGETQLRASTDVVVPILALERQARMRGCDHA